jgi:hypothetical protein
MNTVERRLERLRGAEARTRQQQVRSDPARSRVPGHDESELPRGFLGYIPDGLNAAELEQYLRSTAPAIPEKLF